MASITKVSSTSTAVTVRISSMQYQAKYYQAFRARVSWGVWVTIYPSTSDTNYYSGPMTIDGLSPGTSYTFNAQASYEGVWYDIPDATFSTDASPVPSVPSAPTLSTRGETTLALSWGSVSGATSYTLKKDSTTYTVSGTSYTLTGLTPGTDYALSVRACNASGCSAYSGINYATTYPKIPNSAYSSATTSSVTIAASGMSGNWTGYRVTVYTSGGSYVKTVTSTSSNIVITGLSAGTSYKFYTDSYVDTGSIVYSNGTTLVTASTLVAIPATPSAPTLLSRGDASLSLDWSDVSGATSYTLKLRDSISWEYSGITSSNAVRTGLSYGTTYYVSVKACNASGCSAYSGENPATTLPKAPTISLESKGSTFININAWYMEGNWDGFRARVYAGGSLVKTVTSATSPIAITGLTPGVDYIIHVDAYLGSLYSYMAPNIAVTTTNPPTAWSWTAGELSAFNNKGLTSALTYTRWNSFLDKINEWRTYKGLSTVSFSKMTSVDKKLTATRFNVARSAIDDMNSTGLTSVTNQSKVFGSYFITLSTKLNAII